MNGTFGKILGLILVFILTFGAFWLIAKNGSGTLNIVWFLLVAGLAGFLAAKIIRKQS